MITIQCQCGARMSVPQTMVGKAGTCSRCGGKMRLATGEGVDESPQRFDARLIIACGPDRVGEQILLGGEAPIEIGKGGGRHILLESGVSVSRTHCAIVASPTGWRIEDRGSSNGTIVNGHRVSAMELQHGDLVRVGEYEFTYLAHAHQPSALKNRTAGPVSTLPQHVVAIDEQDGATTSCPSCERPLSPGALICTACGINIMTGRPIVISKGFDEEDVAQKADTWIWWVSWIVPLGIFPIMSEAFGTHRPRTTYAITILTILASMIFFVIGIMPDKPSAFAQNLMLWSGKVPSAADAQVPEPTPPRPAAPSATSAPAVDRPAIENYELTKAYIREKIRRMRTEHALEAVAAGAEFRWYQFLTHALLHGGLLHLAGNLLFLLVLGLRVNELIGNVKMAIIYPILAVASGATQWFITRDEIFYPMIGASGAVMGLAGMYFVLFPLQKVRMAIWARWCMAFPPLIVWFWLKVSYKVFMMRGFWLLLLWVVLNDVIPTLVSAADIGLGAGDGIAHWAHLGGFLSGMAIALLLLLTRQVNSRGSDILSVTLGRHAWPLIGKPSQWKDEESVESIAAKAVSLDYR